MIHPSTFSIVAYDPMESALGVAVASKFPAVGAIVPWAEAACGAVATQALANTSFGPHGLDLMRSGLSAQDSLKIMLENDPEREYRQVGLVDAHGGVATFTGQACFHWAGGFAGDGFAVQGNILFDEHVVEMMADTFSKSPGNLPERLLSALLAGDRAGGDRRGRQSAAIYVVKPQGGYGGYTDRWIDYRVDDHPDPVQRLCELFELHALYFGKSPESERLNIKIDGVSLSQLQNILVRQGYYSGPVHGRYDAATQTAFRDFIGNENFEERSDPEAGWIDYPVYTYILKHYGVGL
jgi:uncharacterized Ntn-hydrolase superfamily protein